MTNDKLNKAIGKCEAILAKLAIPYGDIEEYTINTRAKSRWGACIYNWCSDSYLIQITNELCKDGASDKALEETILHELIHTVKGCLNHGYEWQYYANKVNNAYGYNIKRTASYKDKGFETDVMAKERKPKYEITCNACKTKWTYERACKIVKCVRDNNAKCSCGAHNNFTLITLR